jgi:hypothetical protein
MIDWLIKRAQRTPYFHLDGYMNRWWLVPYNKVIERNVPVSEVVQNMTPGAICRAVSTGGTGPVSGFRPLARLLQFLGIAVRVHEILRSDTGRDPHDHPWPYLTIILRGWYWEERFDDEGKSLGSTWYGRGSILFRPAKSWHMLHLTPGKSCWTLFITGRKSQTWGFNTKDGKVPYHQYKDATP